MSDNPEEVNRLFMRENERRILEAIEALTARVITGENETRKKIEFILEQQSETAIKLDRLVETQTSAERRWERTEGSIRDLLAIAELHAQELAGLSEQSRALSEQVRATDDQLRATDDRLNVLVGVVERIITERRSGS